MVDLDLPDSVGERIKDGHHVGLDLYDLFINRRTWSWWRRVKFSSSSATRERKADRKTAKRSGRIHIERELRRGV
jgi:hypothetical protein